MPTRPPTACIRSCAACSRCSSAAWFSSRASAKPCMMRRMRHSLRKGGGYLGAKFVDFWAQDGGTGRGEARGAAPLNGRMRLPRSHFTTPHQPHPAPSQRPTPEEDEQRGNLLGHTSKCQLQAQRPRHHHRIKQVPPAGRWRRRRRQRQRRWLEQRHIDSMRELDHHRPAVRGAHRRSTLHLHRRRCPNPRATISPTSWPHLCAK